MKRVENFRLTKEQLGWMKEAKKINQIKGILAKGALLNWSEKGESLRKIFSQLDEKRKMLNLMAPEEKTDEIPGQEMEEQEKNADLFEMAGKDEGMDSGQMGRDEGFVQ